MRQVFERGSIVTQGVDRVDADRSVHRGETRKQGDSESFRREAHGVFSLTGPDGSSRDVKSNKAIETIEVCTRLNAY